MNKAWRPVLSATLLSAASICAQGPVVPVYGTAAGEHFGESIGDAGDVNGDGYPDIIVGSPTYSAGTGTLEGRIQIISGQWLASLVPGVPAPPPVVLFSRIGPTAGDRYGRVSLKQGDVDGDGIPDFVVGNNGQNVCQTPAGGAVEVLNGAAVRAIAMGLPPVVPLVLSTITAPSGSSGVFGLVVDGSTDLTGDGLADVIIGHRNQCGAPGQVHIYVKGPGTGYLPALRRTLTDGVNGTDFGLNFRVIGDVNGDGVADILVGARQTTGTGGQSNAGAAHLFSGNSAGPVVPSGTPIWSTLGGAANELLGVGLAFLGDITGDLIADFAVGGQLDCNVGSSSVVRIYQGGGPGFATLNRTVSMPATAPAQGGFGSAIAGVDVDGDHVAELIVGGFCGIPGALGAAHTFRVAGTAGPLYSVSNGLPNTAFGATVVGGMDINLDGLDDYVVTAFQDSSPPLTGCGSITVVYGQFVGTGQANSTLARLEVNGIGTGTTRGPFTVNTPVGRPLTFRWSGCTAAPIILVQGALAPGAPPQPCLGSFDLLISPFPSILADGTQPGLLNALFTVGGTCPAGPSACFGQTTMAFTTPGSLLGMTTDIQAALILPPSVPCPPATGCGTAPPVVLTAAFRLTFW